MSAPWKLSDYTIGWISALEIELAVAMATLDEEHPDLQVDESDRNSYTFGRIGQHNVVIACLCLGRKGATSAATVAKDMMRSFKSLRFWLMVGVGGGVPGNGNDIRLGDVVVSVPDKQYAGVVQYDIGKAENGGVFSRTGALDAPPEELLAALSKLKAKHRLGKTQIAHYLENIKVACPESTRQDPETDVLYCGTYHHVGGESCEKCDKERVERRDVRTSTNPVIHYGTIASGNRVIKDSTCRDRLSKELGGVLCFEMEAAGLMNSFRCLVIRGISDYADSHKNDRWQAYAAATSAAYAKELLYTLSPSQVATAQVATAQVAELGKSLLITDQRIVQHRINL